MRKARDVPSIYAVVLIRRYRSTPAYESDAQHLMQNGYKIVSVQECPRRYKPWEIAVAAGMILTNPLHRTDLEAIYSRI